MRKAWRDWARLAIPYVATLLTSAHAAPSPDPAIATRGSDTITISQARAFIAKLEPAARAKLAHDPSALTPILRDMLLSRAILAEADARHWAERPEIAELLTRAREQVLVESYLSASSTPPASFPTDADIRAAYDQNKQRLLLPRQFHLAQAFLPASQANARARLQALKRAGAPGLAAAARKTGIAYTDMGWIADTALAPAVKQAVAGLPEGQIADPICTAPGCSLILLIATKPSGPASLPEAHDTLVRALRQQRQQANERTYEDTLLARAPVRVNELQYSAVLGP